MGRGSGFGVEGLGFWAYKAPLRVPQRVAFCWFFLLLVWGSGPTWEEHIGVHSYSSYRVWDGGGFFLGLGFVLVFICFGRKIATFSKSVLGIGVAALRF